MCVKTQNNLSPSDAFFTFRHSNKSGTIHPYTWKLRQYLDTVKHWPFIFQVINLKQSDQIKRFKVLHGNSRVVPKKAD